jgi:endogenous inhibitor of DNA gyrase (YacG/DUF329 family)
MTAKCPYCGKPIETPVPRKIIDRAWNPARQKQEVRTQTIDFCSQDCGGYYQMGCEG